MSGAQSDSPKKNILIVDDSRDNLRLLADILVRHGYLVRPVPDGQLALSSARTTHPDLILLDIMMPGLSGYDVCGQLKADDEMRDIPVIFMSALNEVLDKVKAFTVGGVDYITKPFQTAEVLARINTHLTLRNLQKTLQQKNDQLQQEILVRERVERAMRRRNWELDLLTQMNTALQMCSKEQETYAVLKQGCQQLFPSSSGCMVLLDDQYAVLDSTATAWGEIPPPDVQILDTIGHEQYHGRVYTFEHARHVPLHLALNVAESDGWEPYALRDAAGRVLGMLLLVFAADTQEGDEEDYVQITESRHLVVTRVMEQYSLFLTNLRLREALKREAIRDPLTNLFNRRYMEEALTREFQRAERYKTSIGIIMLDVDHFKRFNDTFGHDTGDQVLEQLGILLQKSIRGEDIACRYGGEEFLLILPDTTLETTELRAQDLLRRARGLHISRHSDEFHLTVSLGVSAFPLHGHDIQRVVSAADRALYQAKSRGRDQVVTAS